MSAQPSTIAIKLRRIREAYLKQLPAQLEVIRETFFVLESNNPAPADLEDLHRRLHTLKGASASFGLVRVSAVADAGEHLAKGALAGAAAPDAAWRRQMAGVLADLEEEIAAIDPSQDTDPKVQELLAAAQRSKSDSERKMVFLCEDDPFQRQSIATQIGCFGFEVISFDKLESLRDAVRNSPPDAIVMDMTFPDRPEGGGEVIGELRSAGELPPTVFISSQHDISYRLSAVRAGSSAYFVKPLNIIDLCSTLHALTSTAKPEPYRVMIVDDDVNLANYHALFLQEAGMETLTVDDPLRQVMARLFEFKPDLILMDMYMPGCNGVDLAKAIRQIGAYFSIPIVFLSSETDMEKQFDAMRMGGDEFLTKPIKPEHLVSAVAVRAERMKIMRAHMVRDSLTGLLNHSSALEYLEMSVAQAQRQGGKLCLAVIDLDHFKEINDNYGHPAGDRVLIALAQMLKQRLRRADVVGRIGGEEFLAVLPDCDLATALPLFEQLRQSLATLQFAAEKESFSVTFSCGIASLSRYGDAAQLHKAADAALYRAKEGGRNRVVGDDAAEKGG